ncbi:MAG TPA: hypothetical protein GXX75_17200 [Clostridiales bacterium]|nr:hypothetical protein [Clostridiales bacterium]
MKSKFFRKCFLSLGLFLFLSLLIPFSSWNTVSVQAAATTNNEKGEDYRLNLKSVSIVKGKTFALKVYNVNENAKVTYKYKSGDADIASVSDDGVITANKIGSTTVTVTIKSGSSTIPLTCDVTVGPPAFSVRLTRSRIVIGLDKSDFLNVILKPTNTVEVARFSSYNYNIASVSSGGRVTGRQLGLTYLFAVIDAIDSDGSQKYSRCTVIVTSSDNASLLESYFAEHPELDLIAQDELDAALDQFFNVKYDPSSSSSLVNSLNRYLDDNFNLSELKKQYDSSKPQSNSIEIVRSN